MKLLPRTRIALLVILLAVALSVSAYFLLRSPQSAPQAEPRAAWDFCRSVILAELRSPQTAVFTPYNSGSVTADSAEIYRVMIRLQTDDMNGNTIPVNALCRLRWDGEAFNLLGLQMR